MGNAACCVIEIFGWGREKLLELLYIVMQRPVGHVQIAQHWHAAITQR